MQVLQVWLQPRRIYSADTNNIGLNVELDAILSVALGGNSLGGGKFSLAGSIIGAYTIQRVHCCGHLHQQCGAGLEIVGPIGNFSSFSPFSKLLLSFDMLVGRLVNAFAVVVLNLVAVLRGTERVEVFGRELSYDSIRRSNATVVMSISVLFVFVFILTIWEPQASVMALLFECVSALSTVGSSLNLTPTLGDNSKLLVAFLMFIGRVGLITLMLGIIKQKKHTKYQYPSGQIIIN